MRAVANDRIRIWRGNKTDAFGDLVDADNEPVGETPAMIRERDRRVYLPAEGATRVIRAYYARVGPEVDIRKGDRIEAIRSGRRYLVTEISDPLSAVMRPDIQLTLSRTD